MAIDFYYAPFSSSSPVHWALEELGIPYNKKKKDLKAGETKTPEYLAMNPNGKVPMLVVDGKPLFESLAINLYLAHRFGEEKKLWPGPNDPARLEALSWTVWATTELGGAIGAFFRATTFGGNVPAAEAWIRTSLTVLEGRLEGRPYILGAHFSLADVANASVVSWGRSIKIDVSPFPRVTAWSDRCTDRPGLKTSE